MKNLTNNNSDTEKADFGQSKKELMRQHSILWEESKLSQDQYCLQAGITMGSFNYWRHYFLREKRIQEKLIQTENQVGNFIPVIVKNNMNIVNNSHIKITCANNIHLTIDIGANINYVTALVKAIGGGQC